jgi:hypothetical protein
MKKIYSIEERKKYCERWRSSGLPKLIFSRENKISESALRKWLNLYEPNLLNVEGKKPKLKFLAIEPAKPKEQKEIEIILPNGIMLKTMTASISGLIKELSL